MSSFTKLCRLCLKKCRADDNYEDLGHDYSIRCRIAIKEIFNIIHGNNATFPTKVCIECSHKVLLFYDYFVVVQKNQEILVNGINAASSHASRPRETLINPLSMRHYTAIPSTNVMNISSEDFGGGDMELDNSMDAFRSDSNIVEAKPEIFSTPKPFLTFEERKAIEEKIKMIKETMTDDEKIKIFYGLQCTTCNTSVEFNKLTEYEEHCLKEHDIEVTSFMCCKTKIRREFLIDHIEYHLGTPAVRMLRPRGQNAKNQENNSLNGNVTPAEQDETNDSIYKFPCNKCERSYMVKSSLKRHQTLAHGFICDVCDKVFDNDHKLKKHQFIFHSTDGPFKCTICPSEHNTRQELYNHKRWHTRQSTTPNAMSISLPADGENDENDDDEATSTENQSNLDDRRRFKCSLCSSAFHSTRNLKIHMSLKHKKTILAKVLKNRYAASPFKPAAGVTKLRCKSCGFLSMYRQNMKRHIRLRHADEASNEDEVVALFEDMNAKDANQENNAANNQGENEQNNAEKEMQVTQIKEEQDDSINMFQCLSNSLLS
ncbi:zinc finger protein 808-like [Culicoides brevitarsis]|uniref:zinc finger protein 808-like n=1 Tax=Culicoides brevitarsis TaxID=469753 RepID=UPI00307B93DE